MDLTSSARRFILTSWRDFSQNFQKPKSESRRGQFSRQLLPLFQTCSRRITNRGNGKVCFIKTKTAPTTNSISRSPWRCVFLVILLGLALALVAPSQTVQAVTPAPDGGYPGNNTAEGEDALFSLTTGVDNTAIGFNALFSNTTGFFNTVIGSRALFSNTEGGENTATGFHALFYNTTGFNNTATGANALLRNTTGDNNTATGDGALQSNTTGFNNTATGFALGNNTTGSQNTGNGHGALALNTTASNNTATGYFALFSNRTAGNNTATGANALFYNQEGRNNTANGFEAMFNNLGGNNTATGFQALFNNNLGNANTASGADALLMNNDGSQNTATGANALRSNTTGSNNIAVGANAGRNLTTGDSNIDIGNQGVAGDSGAIRIGTASVQTATFIAGIYGTTIGNGVLVTIGPRGKLGTLQSSARFKEAIKPMDKASEAILALKPVTFRYKEELDPDKMPQFGLVAEEVEKVNRDLVVRDGDGKVSTVRYEAVNAMLLNEFLKEHRKVQELEAIAAKQEAAAANQQKEIKALTASLKEQASQIQKVSAQLDVSKTAPQVVLNNQ